MTQRSTLIAVSVVALLGLCLIIFVGRSKQEEYEPIPERPPTFEEIMHLADENRATNSLIASYINSQPEGIGFAKIVERAQIGDDEAELMQCYLMIVGLGTPRDEENGYKICEISAKKGFAAAKANLIYHNFMNDPETLDWDEAFHAFKELAKTNPKHGHRGLQALYRHEFGNGSGRLMRLHLKKAIKHGNTNAMHALSEFDLHSSDYRLRNYPRAKANLTRAYELNDFGAGYKLAIEYRDGEHFEKDIETYLSIIQRLVAFEYPDALAEMAYNYTTGTIVEKDENMSTQLYIHAAKLGHEHAMLVAGLHLIKLDQSEDDKQLGLKFLEQIAEAGDTHAMNILIRHYSKNSSPKVRQKALKWHIQAALHGDISSQETLLWRYMEKGYMPEFKPYIETLTEWHEAGYGEASYHLARQYRAASGVDRDLRKAKDLLKSAAHAVPEKAAAELDIIEGFIQHYGSIENVPDKILDQ